MKENETARFYDEEVVKEKNISLFENNGLIRLFKSYFQQEDNDKTMLGKKRRHWPSKEMMNKEELYAQIINMIFCWLIYNFCYDYKCLFGIF